MKPAPPIAPTNSAPAISSSSAPPGSGAEPAADSIPARDQAAATLEVTPADSLKYALLNLKQGPADGLDLAIREVLEELDPSITKTAREQGPHRLNSLISAVRLAANTADVQRETLETQIQESLVARLKLLVTRSLLAIKIAGRLDNTDPLTEACRAAAPHIGWTTADLEIGILDAQKRRHLNIFHNLLRIVCRETLPPTGITVDECEALAREIGVKQIELEIAAAKATGEQRRTRTLAAS